MAGATITKVFKPSGFGDCDVGARSCTHVPQMHTAHCGVRDRRDNGLGFTAGFPAVVRFATWPRKWSTRGTPIAASDRARRESSAEAVREGLRLTAGARAR